MAWSTILYVSGPFRVTMRKKKNGACIWSMIKLWCSDADNEVITQPQPFNGKIMRQWQPPLSLPRMMYSSLTSLLLPSWGEDWTPLPSRGTVPCQPCLTRARIGSRGSTFFPPSTATTVTTFPLQVGQCHITHSSVHFFFAVDWGRALSAWTKDPGRHIANSFALKQKCRIEQVGTYQSKLRPSANPGKPVRWGGGKRGRAQDSKPTLSFPRLDLSLSTPRKAAQCFNGCRRITTKKRGSLYHVKLNKPSKTLNGYMAIPRKNIGNCTIFAW